MSQLPAVTVPAKFIGMHYDESIFAGDGSPTLGASAPTYGPKIWRTQALRCFWPHVETSAGVFDWTRLDARIGYFYGLGQDIYYQCHATPSFHQGVGATWTTVSDQYGVNPCVPDLTAFSTFVSTLVARYVSRGTPIKYISFVNEPKPGVLPTIELRRSVAQSVTPLAAGDSVIGQTSGATGTVVSNSGTVLTIRMLAPTTSATPFGNTETVQKVGDATRYWTASQQNAVNYFYGSNADLVAMQQSGYAAAKAADPNITVMWPDFVDGGDHAETEWLTQFFDAGGLAYGDALAYHFYCYELAPESIQYRSYSLPARLDSLDVILAARRRSGVPKIASEVGFQPTFSFYLNQSNRLNQAQTIKRVMAYLAARGWSAAIGFDHTNEYIGDPEANTENADALKWAGVTLSGADISSASVLYDNSLVLAVDGRTVTL